VHGGNIPLRKKIHDQQSIVYPFIDHEHARELRKISDLLNRLPLAGDLVFADLTCDDPDVSVGRPGLSGDQVLRLLILKQMHDFSYEELAARVRSERTGPIL